MIVTHLKNIQLKLEEAAGGAVAVELRMRLIAELSLEVRTKLTERITIENQKRLKKNPKARTESDNYWECGLGFLDGAIDAVYGASLERNGRETLKKFRPYRNKLLHGDFIGLLLELGVTPTGRDILNMAGDRNILREGDIKEAIVGIATGRHKSLDEVRILASYANNILDNLIQKFPNN